MKLPALGWTIPGSWLPARVFVEALHWLRSSGETSVESPYRFPPLFTEPGLDRDYTLWSREDIEDDLKEFLRQFPIGLELLVEKNFPGLSHQICPFKNRRTLAVYTIDFEDGQESMKGRVAYRLSPATYRFFRSDAGEDFKIDVLNGKKLEHAPGQASWLDAGEVVFEGPVYRLIQGKKQCVDFLTGQAPTFEAIYDYLGRQLDDYMDIHFKAVRGSERFRSPCEPNTIGPGRF